LRHFTKLAQAAQQRNRDQKLQDQRRSLTEAAGRAWQILLDTSSNATGAKAKAWCLHIPHAEASLSLSDAV
jgi:hypothetical protein